MTKNVFIFFLFIMNVDYERLTTRSEHVESEKDFHILPAQRGKVK